KAYIGDLNHLADSAQSSNPKLADVYRQLAQIAAGVHHIPNHKTVVVTVEEYFKYYNKPPAGVIGPSTVDPTGAKAAAAAAAKLAQFTTTIPIGVRINLQRAQNTGDVAAQRKYLQEEKAFLEKQLAKAQRDRNKQEELQALQAIGDVDSQLQSLQTASTKSHD